MHAGFTGHEHDPERGLINMKGRIYDPELGRFTTPDPLVQAPFFSQSLNRYAYVFNNPLRYTDPSGFTGQQIDPKTNAGYDPSDKGPGRIEEIITNGGITEYVVISWPSQGAEPKADTSANAPQAEKDARGPEHSQKKHAAVQRGGKGRTQSFVAVNQTAQDGPQVGFGEAVHSEQTSQLRGDSQSAGETYRGGAASFQGVSASPSPQGEGSSEQHRDRIKELGGPVGVMIESGKTVVSWTVCGIFGCAEAGGSIGEKVESKSELEKMAGTALLVGGGAVVGKVVRGVGQAARIVSKIDRAAFRAEREAFWKAEAKNNPQQYTPENLARMEEGRPPIGPDGYPMELHHVDRTPEGGVTPMSRTDHRLGPNYKINHP